VTWRPPAKQSEAGGRESTWVCIELLEHSQNIFSASFAPLIWCPYIAIDLAGRRPVQSNSCRLSSLSDRFPYFISRLIDKMAVSITSPRSYTRIISNVLNDVGSDRKPLVQLPKHVTDYLTSCSDVLLNGKQLNSKLQNVATLLFAVWFRPGRVRSVYHLKPCFDATHSSILATNVCFVFQLVMRFDTEKD